MQPDLFADERRTLPLGPDAALLGGFATESAEALISHIQHITASSPFRHMETRSGKRMSVAMSNCGSLGWVSDRSGYRYDALDPLTGNPWPHMPRLFRELAEHAARSIGFHNFTPEACLINQYRPGARLSLHQDMDEQDRTAPIVSVSLGLPATFLWGGHHRACRPKRYSLIHGDVVVWGGASRMIFHGIDVLKEGKHPLTEDVRFNLTFRKVR
nr:DNA oxidative demethylase AlkB [Saccharibacter sp. 17.LH.SD]